MATMQRTYQALLTDIAQLDENQGSDSLRCITTPPPRGESDPTTETRASVSRSPYRVPRGQVEAIGRGMTRRRMCWAVR